MKEKNSISDKLVYLDRSIEKWIENNRFKWCLLLIFIAFVLGFSFNFLLGGDFGRGIIISSIYTMFLIFKE